MVNLEAKIAPRSPETSSNQSLLEVKSWFFSIHAMSIAICNRQLKKRYLFLEAFQPVFVYIWPGICIWGMIPGCSDREQPRDVYKSGFIPFQVGGKSGNCLIVDHKTLVRLVNYSLFQRYFSFALRFYSKIHFIASRKSSFIRFWLTKIVKIPLLFTSDMNLTRIVSSISRTKELWTQSAKKTGEKEGKQTVLPAQLLQTQCLFIVKI